MLLLVVETHSLLPPTARGALQLAEDEAERQSFELIYIYKLLHYFICILFIL